MPRIHFRTFRVRYYECDAFGHLNNANYVRYMQEAAFDASAAAGYDLDRYDEMNRLWLVRGTDIEYLSPVQYNQTVEVKTWVMDFQRARSRRCYEFRLAGSEELVARAVTDWVYMDSENSRPTPIPDEMKTAFFPEGLPETLPPRLPHPNAPPPPAGVFKLRRKVAWRDIDTARIVNNPVYLEYAEECGMQVVAAHNWPVERMLADGFAILLRRQQIQYLQPARLGEELEIATWVSDVRRSTADRHYTIHRVSDGALLTTFRTLGVWVDLSNRRPVRIPPQMIEDFRPNIVTTDGKG